MAAAVTLNMLTSAFLYMCVPANPPLSLCLQAFDMQMAGNLSSSESLLLTLKAIQRGLSHSHREILIKSSGGICRALVSSSLILQAG